VGGGRQVEHASRAAAEAYVEELRARYRAGATRQGLVRLYGPEGGVRLVDFAAELADASRALRDLERATAAKDRAVAAALAPWHAAIRQAVDLGQPLDDVAAAAGVTTRELRALMRTLAD
jgi:hypothetical protein